MSVQRFLPIARLCIVYALCAALPAQAEVPMQEYIELERTDYAVAGAGGIGASALQGGAKAP